MQNNFEPSKNSHTNRELKRRNLRVNSLSDRSFASNNLKTVNNLVERLSSMDLTGDRINLDGLNHNELVDMEWFANNITLQIRDAAKKTETENEKGEK